MPRIPHTAESPASAPVNLEAATLEHTTQVESAIQQVQRAERLGEAIHDWQHSYYPVSGDQSGNRYRISTDMMVPEEVNLNDLSLAEHSKYVPLLIYTEKGGVLYAKNGKLHDLKAAREKGVDIMWELEDQEAPIVITQPWEIEPGRTTAPVTLVRFDRGERELDQAKLDRIAASDHDVVSQGKSPFEAADELLAEVNPDFNPELLGPNSAPAQPEAHQAAASASKNIERRQEGQPWGEQRSYAPDARGDVYLTSLFDGEGDRLVLNDHKATRRLNRQLVITDANGNRYFIHGDRLFDMNATDDKGRAVTVELTAEEPFPDIVIGEKWWSPLGPSAEVLSVEVLEAKIDAGEAENYAADYPPTGDVNDLAEIYAELKPYRDLGFVAAKPSITYDRAKKFKQVAVDTIRKTTEKTAEAGKRAGKALKMAASRGSGLAKKLVSVKTQDKIIDAGAKAFIAASETIASAAVFSAALHVETTKIVEDMLADNPTQEELDQESWARKVRMGAMIGPIALSKMPGAVKIAWEKRTEREPFSTDADTNSPS